MDEQKNTPEKKNPPLYKIVDTAFHALNDRKWYPKYLKDNPEISATVLGSTGTYFVLDNIQNAVAKLTPEFYEHAFKGIEMACAGALTIGLSYLASTGKLKEWAKAHPVYTPGMTSAVFMSYATAVNDLLFK